VADSFDHERMDAYRYAIDFLVIADRIAATLPKGRRYIKDQLIRAALSISNNIAEGAGEFALDEKARFYRMAKRSATECAALVDACARLDLGDRAARADARALLLSIVAQLTALVRIQRPDQTQRRGRG
jgi:four helix bundle protein